jgi:hypothetical protein
MSRSYKSRCWLKDSTHGMKTLANRKVRNTGVIASGMSYKKVFESYDISDFKWNLRDLWKWPEHTEKQIRRYTNK